MKTLPTQKRLRELFTFEESTGNLIWKTRAVSDFKNEQASRRWNTRYAGKGAGSLDKAKSSGYMRICIDSRSCQAHRLVWVLHHGAIPAGLQIDHLNNDRSDNRLKNLRLATNLQNQFNSARHANNKSGFKGVGWNTHARKWQAQININGTRKYLGKFSTREAAAACYAAAAIAHHGKFIHSSVVDALSQPLQAALTQKPIPKRRRAKRPPEQLSLPLEVV
jgi:hypothetical protein